MYVLNTLTVLCQILIILEARHLENRQTKQTLKWPPKYTFKVVKISLTSGIVHNMEVWYDKNHSRQDFISDNRGTVRLFKLNASVKGSPAYGIQYRFFPKTSQESEDSYIDCTTTEGTENKTIVAEDFLPDTFSEYRKQGIDKVTDIETTKFYYEINDSEIDEKCKHTIWASYDDATGSWIPVRYEKIIFNSWIGKLKVRDIWEFYEFSTTFDENVFDYTKFSNECNDPEESKHFRKEVKDDHENAFDPENEDHVDKAFKAYKEKHNRKYSNSDHEMRKRIFQQNMRYIKSKNKQNLSYALTANKFADSTREEIQRRMGSKKTSIREKGNIPFPYNDVKGHSSVDQLPPEYDLRLSGLVTPVLDQGDCNCSWSIATTSALEGVLARKNGGRLLALSNQALIDCAWGFGGSGCNGGSDIAAYKWMMKYGLPTVEEYGPFLEQDGVCAIKNMTTRYKIAGYTDVTPLNIVSLKLAIINNGPVTTSIHVTQPMLFYSNGIFYEPDCPTSPPDLDHEVTLVGYDVQDGVPFWIIKNSWGSDWGIDGYIHMSMLENNCGVTTQPTYPVI